MFQSPRNRVNTSNVVGKLGNRRGHVVVFQSPRNRVNTSNLDEYDAGYVWHEPFGFNPLEIGSTLQM